MFEELSEGGSDGSSRLKQEQCNSGGLLCARSWRRCGAVGGRRLHDRGEAAGKVGIRLDKRRRQGPTALTQRLSYKYVVLRDSISKMAVEGSGWRRQAMEAHP